jgi:phage terminase large subunit
MIETWGVEIIFIDSAAAQFSADLAYNYDIATTKAKKDVLPGIAHIQTLVKQGRLRVLKSCTHVLDMLDQYRWDDREGLTKERPKHDKFSHMADALRYALYTFTV